MKTTVHYSLVKIKDGGRISRADAIQVAKKLGAEVDISHSPYVGHYGIRVRASERMHKRLSREFFGPPAKRINFEGRTQS